MKAGGLQKVAAAAGVALLLSTGAAFAKAPTPKDGKPKHAITHFSKHKAKPDSILLPRITLHADNAADSAMMMKEVRAFYSDSAWLNDPANRTYRELIGSTWAHLNVRMKRHSEPDSAETALMSTYQAVPLDSAMLDTLRRAFFDRVIEIRKRAGRKGMPTLNPHLNNSAKKFANQLLEAAPSQIGHDFVVNRDIPGGSGVELLCHGTWPNALRELPETKYLAGDAWELATGLQGSIIHNNYLKMEYRRQMVAGVGVAARWENDKDGWSQLRMIAVYQVAYLDDLGPWLSECNRYYQY